MALIAKPKAKSLVWMYFGLKADSKGRPLNNGQCICRLCRKIVLAKNGNTTNLRSHLRRRHRAKFSSSSAAFEIPDLKSDELEDLPHLQNVSSQNYIPDAEIPPEEPWLHGGPTRAVLSLPSCLCLCEDVAPVMDGTRSFSEQPLVEIKVYAKCLLEPGVLFGPYLGVCKERIPNKLKYAWAIRDEAAFTYIDAADENKSNWMRYVTYTRMEEEHNLVVFQFFRRIYYRVTRQITEGTELKVWIGRDYATLLGLGMDDNVKCEVGEKETVLQLLQDIQLVTLPELNSSSVWSDYIQSQSPMTLTNDMTTMTNLDSMTDTSTLGPAQPSPSSSSLFSCPSPGYNTTDKFDFMPGSEHLLCAPNTPTHSPWFFVGYEPDASGMPLDPSAVVCKLCGDVVRCGGGPVNIQNHLLNKHHIKTRDSNRDQTTGSPFHNLSSAIISFLIMDLQPPSVIEGQGFRQLIQTLAPSHRELPTYRQLNQLLKCYFSKGKLSIAEVLKKNAKMPDSNASINFESTKRKRPPSELSEGSLFVILSVEIWLHSWQGKTEQYLTLWAHYIDSDFTLNNMALTTQRLVESEEKEHSLQALETQVKAIAQEWGILQPSMILVGGEGRNTMWLQSPKSDEGDEAPESHVHPNSTTFLEREDSIPPDEARGSEQGCSGVGVLSVPCFFRVVQDCIEEVMTHPIISKTLDHFQSLLSDVFMPVAQPKNPYQNFNESPLQILTQQELAGLKSWAHNRPVWSKLYSLLGIVIKHKSLFSEIIKDMKYNDLSEEDTSSEPGPSKICQTNSTSSSSCAVLCSEWKVLEDLRLVLRPLDVACQTLAKETFPRLSLIKPILTGLLSRHLVLQQSDSLSIKEEVKKMMRKSLLHSYNSFAVNKALCVACAFDPHFIGLGFMDVKEQIATFDWLKKDSVRIVKEVKMGRQVTDRSRSPSSFLAKSDDSSLRRSKRVRRSHHANFQVKEDGEAEEECDVEEEDEDGSEDECPSQEGLSGLEFLLGDLYPSTPKSKQNSIEESIDVEVSVYRSSKVTALGIDPLQWWIKNEVHFPLLATVARAYLAVPAVAGNAVQDFLQEVSRSVYKKRDNVPPESLDPILFLHYNRMFNAVAAGKV